MQKEVHLNKLLLLSSLSSSSSSRRRSQEEEDGFLWHINYPLKDEKNYLFARMRSVDAIVRSALLKQQQQQQQQQDVITLDDDEELNNVKQKNNTNKRAALDELQRTALHILSLLENDNKTKFHERLSCTSYSPE